MPILVYRCGDDFIEVADFGIAAMLFVYGWLFIQFFLRVEMKGYGTNLQGRRHSRSRGAISTSKTAKEKLYEKIF